MIADDLGRIMNEMDGPVIHRNRGIIPGCIMLPPSPPERSLLEMQADNEAFHRRVQSYIDSKLDYERVW